MSVYADFNGSAPLCPEVKKYLEQRLKDGPFANPNAIHRQGQRVMQAMNEARRTLGEVVGAKPKEIFFNSGSSEGISHVFYSLLLPFIEKQEGRGKKIVISSIEHSAIHQAADSFKVFGFEVYKLPANEKGVVEARFLEEFFATLKNPKEEVALVSVMAANNETGALQPYEEIGSLCQEAGVLYFSDTTQFIGKVPFDFSKSKMDFAVMSSHKVGALIGSGAVLAKDPSLLRPHVFGGGQEKGLRGGTQNYIGIECMAVAMNHFKEWCTKEVLEKAIVARREFEGKLKKEFPSLVILSEGAERIPGTTLLSYPGIHGQAIQIELESMGIFVTTSSACSDNSPTTSKVLKAMNVTDDIGRGVVRLSICPLHTDVYGELGEALTVALKKLSKVKAF